MLDALDRWVPAFFFGGGRESGPFDFIRFARVCSAILPVCASVSSSPFPSSLIAHRLAVMALVMRSSSSEWTQSFYRWCCKRCKAPNVSL
jgi:hypothetical protein